MEMSFQHSWRPPLKAYTPRPHSHFKEGQSSISGNRERWHSNRRATHSSSEKRQAGAQSSQGLALWRTPEFQGANYFQLLKCSPEIAWSLSRLLLLRKLSWGNPGLGCKRALDFHLHLVTWAGFPPKRVTWTHNPLSPDVSPALPDAQFHTTLHSNIPPLTEVARSRHL